MWNDIKALFSTFLAKIDYIQIGLFVLIIIIGFIVRKVAMKSVTAFFRIIDKKTKTDLFENYLKPTLKPVGNFVMLLALYIAVNAISIPNQPYPIKVYLSKILSLILILNVSWFLSAIVNILMLSLESVTSRTESKLDDQLVPILKKFLRAFIFIVAGLLIMQNLGYSVSGILAGIGVGGFALAFAAKDALANIFGSIIIFTDRPFQVGDWVKASGSEGIIEEVGLRSTKIRTFEKTLITVPNSHIASMVVENVSARPKRRVSFSLGVTYSTNASQLKEALSSIKEILKNHPGVDQEYWLVNFTNFGASSLEIFIYYFTKTAVWADYLDIKQEVNLLIMEKLEELGVGIAFPSTSVYIEKMPEEFKK